MNRSTLREAAVEARTLAGIWAEGGRYSRMFVAVATLLAAHADTTCDCGTDEFAHDLARAVLGRDT